MKKLLKVLRISSQCERCCREIWNLKDVTLIDRENFKAQSKAKNYKFIKKAKLFTQRQMSHCKQNNNANKKKARRRI